jgi:hypothetical protein
MLKKDVKSITFVKTYTVSLSLSGNGGHIKVNAIKQIRWIGIKFAKAMLGRIKSVFKKYIPGYK